MGTLRAVFLLSVKSPLIWFSTPFAVALAVLTLNEDMPFAPYSSLATPLIIFTVLLPFALVYLAASVAFRGFSIGNWRLRPHPTRRQISTLPYLIPWALISVIEVLDFPGLPLLTALMGGGDKNYTEFGIPTVHGFANLLWLISVVIEFSKWTAGRRPPLILVLLVAWPLLCLSRGMFLIVLFILCALYVSSSRFHPRTLSWAGLIVAAIVIPGFGYLGSIRVEDFSLAARLDIAEDISPGWLWGYVYLTSPICNFANTVQSIQPAETLLPVATLSALIPSALKPALGVETGFDAYIGAPVMPFLNAGTAFRSPYLDWGIPGVVLVSATLAFVAAYVRHRADRYGSLALAFLNAMLLLCIFNNNLLAPTFLFVLLWLTHIEAREANFPKTRRLSIADLCLREPRTRLISGQEPG